MQIFQSNDDRSFYYNNRKYVANFIVHKIGSEAIAVYNAYDSRMQLMPATHFSEVMVDEVVFQSQQALMDVLSPITFVKVDSDSNQNNLGQYFQFGILSGTGAITTTEVANYINSQVFAFVVSETQTPTILEFLRLENEVTSKYLFMWTKGKGIWGTAGGNTVLPAWFRLLSIQTQTPEDIENDENSQINNLGIIEDGDFVTIANETEWNLTNPDKSYYFSYTQDDVLYFVLFVGEPGIYGGDSISSDDFNASDFISTTNSQAQPTPSLQQVLQAGYQANGEIGLFRDPNTPQTKYQEIWGGGLYHEQANGDLTIKYPDNLQHWNVEYTWPAKSNNDTIAMLSDVSAIASGTTLQTVMSNGSTASLASDIVITNLVGTIQITDGVGINLSSSQGFSLYADSGGQITTDPTTGIRIQGNGGGVSIGGNTLGVDITGDGGGVLIDGGNDGIILNGGSSGITFQGSSYYIDNNPFEYSIDLSNVITERSLVDKGYVDISISAATSGGTPTIDHVLGAGGDNQGWSTKYLQLTSFPIGSDIPSSANSTISLNTSSLHRMEFNNPIASGGAVKNQVNITGHALEILYYKGGILTSGFNLIPNSGRTFHQLIAPSVGTVIASEQYVQNALSGISTTTNWGAIQGALSAQTDLHTALNARYIKGTDSLSGITSISFVSSVPSSANTNTAYIVQDNTVQFKGSISVSGNGTTTISIPHSLGEVPVYINVQAKNAAASGITYVEATLTQINVHYASAPIGTLDFWVNYNN